MTNQPAIWEEADSRTFIDYGSVFIPQREVQIETIGDLIPQKDEPFRILELSCGEGILAESLLTRFPNATLYGYDISDEMLRAARQRLAKFGDRFQTRYFDLADLRWRQTEPKFHAVVSSLTIHHLDGPEKLRLFMDLYQMLDSGGVLVIADVVETTRKEGTAVSAKGWDDAVKRRALDLNGNLDAFTEFQKLEWNMYLYPEEGPEVVDKPSTLFDQLKWMEQARFTAVDVHWMEAGHVVFSGLKQ